MYMCTNVDMYICIYVYMCICVYVYVYIRKFVYLYICICIWREGDAVIFMFVPKATFIAGYTCALDCFYVDTFLLLPAIVSSSPGRFPGCRLQNERKGLGFRGLGFRV